MKKLIRQLKFAHAAEIAAYHAYEGHWRSVSNQAEQAYIQKIALDELKHIYAIEKMLQGLQSKPSPVLDKMGKIVGELIGFACYYSGRRLPMLVAGLMEKIGTASYKDIANTAIDSERYIMATHLLEMAKVEQEHEEYFEQLRKAK
ncbi:MAG: ferritin-like domain-containing protein [Leptolyngbyaceae cyanobacterium RM2_2_4]|nr:ferritin-like domain-containing protein [Leptolyngbyaceae cyanobacterium RM2_2_4]